jgi:Transcriptional regulatory protein, C terminal
MSVNSSFKGFFNTRWMVRFGIVMVTISIFSISSSFAKRTDREFLTKQANIIIREIGHRLLLQAGDSTSRVLPVTEIKEGTFLLEFENEFDFDHDSLIVLSQRLLPKTLFTSGYIVTVHECKTASIVYGFQINQTAQDILACKGRTQPPGCYTIEITFPDFYENAEQMKADMNQLTEEIKSFKGDPYVADPKLENLKPFNIDPQDVNPKREELKSFKVGPDDFNPNLEEFKATTFGYPLINLVLGGMLALLVVTLLIGRYGKRLVPVQVQDNQHSIIRESIPELPSLGKFLFDVKDQRLVLGSEVISLTDKECKILELLNKSFGTLIPRETLMQEIWINEGVITGRSLDMFVSKLRKKLSGDPDLRITNVHGKGYKLEIPGAEIL